MATFYLLPSRPLMGQRFGQFLATLFPGAHWRPSDWPDLAEALGAAALAEPDVYVVYREDLPDQTPLPDTLTRDFGAETGDEVFEVKPGITLGDVTICRWHVGDF